MAKFIDVIIILIVFQFCNKIEKCNKMQRKNSSTLKTSITDDNYVFIEKEEEKNNTNSEGLIKSIFMQNPLILIVCISEYESVNNLNGIQKDEKILTDLFINFFNFDTKVASKNGYLSKKNLFDFLELNTTNLDNINSYDSLFFIFCGYSIGINLFTSDFSRMQDSVTYEYINKKYFSYFINKPTIYLKFSGNNNLYINEFININSIHFIGKKNNDVGKGNTNYSVEAFNLILKNYYKNHNFVELHQKINYTAKTLSKGSELIALKKTFFNNLYLKKNNLIKQKLNTDQLNFIKRSVSVFWDELICKNKFKEGSRYEERNPFEILCNKEFYKIIGKSNKEFIELLNKKIENHNHLRQYSLGNLNSCLNFIKNISEYLRKNPQLNVKNKKIKLSDNLFKYNLIYDI
ncbi:MAG: hypothetical protein GY830_00795 [Bacteroidetes bacterium]|nr:hypothetical protein [Bacteroidota bacterium]